MARRYAWSHSQATPSRREKGASSYLPAVRRSPTTSCGHCAMPASGRPATVLVDTSVAVALVVADHDYHDDTFQALRGRTLGLAGHAAFETFSVLTRLPPPARRTPASVAQLLANTFPESRFLCPAAAASLMATLGVAGIAGGSVYDALVGAVANEHRLTLVTRDRRGLEIYRKLDVEVEVLA
jgi:predicted nucleic acid-binding protein